MNGRAFGIANTITHSSKGDRIIHAVDVLQSQMTAPFCQD